MSDMSEVVEFDQDKADAEALIKDAFEEVIAGGEQDEDNVKLAMINAGASFKNVTRLYNQFMIECGFAISKEDKAAIVSGRLEGRDFDTEESFESAVAEIMDGIAGSTAKSAMAIVRSFAKKAEKPCYVKPKAVSEGSRSGFVHKFYDWLAANPTATEAEAHSYIFGEDGHPETTQNVKNYEKMHQNVRALVNRIASA